MAEIGIDIVSDGTVAGFSFAVEVGTVDATEVRTSNCITRAPKGFTAGCAYANGIIKGIASADAPGTFMPAGVAPVGSVVVFLSLAKGQVIRVHQFETSNDGGGSTVGSAKVHGFDAGSEIGENANK